VFFMSVMQSALLALSVTACSISSIALAQNGQISHDSEIAAVPAAVPIQFSEEGFSGPGADLLRKGLDETQFVMIGEAHGHAEAPQLVSAFASETRAYGFDNYAIEVGPFSADWLESMLQEGGVARLAEELSGRPLAIPFLGSREEARAALSFARNGRLWGVDQEFIGSPLIHLSALQGMNPTNSDLLERLELAEREAFRSGNQGAVMFATMDHSGWSELRAVFDGNDEALALIASMERSQGIYQSFFMGRGLDNNLDRVDLIRRNFLQHYQSALTENGTPPRVLMKFGATHGGRATSSMSTFDLGSLIEGMAASNGLEALHIAYIPIGGVTTAIRLSPDGVFSEKPVEAEALRALLRNSGIDVDAIDASEGHFVIDLEPIKRKLGNGGLAELEPTERFLVLGFDYLITTSAATASTPLASE
jgi:hypothetical protein